MLIQPVQNLVRYEGAETESQAFRFDESNAAHFFGLIANLYSDPVVAVLREIGANAVDAHAMIDNQEQWELHLPTRMDSTIRFVDHGVGMSHDTVMNLYSTVGASTKRDNSSQIGGFGCGRISLFAIVNNFQVISTYSGIRSTYFLCQQQNGLPDIKVIKQEETTDANGVEVKFACPERYVSEFKEKYVSAYKWFSIKPRIFIGSEEIIRSDWDIKNPVFESVDKSYNLTGEYDSSFVVMGGVGYRLPVEMIVQESKFKRWSAILSHGLVIFAPIGEYSITPSREAIKFDHITSNHLIAKLEEILSSILPKLQTEMDAFVGNSREAKLKFKQIKKDLGFLPDFSLTWNGEPITADPFKLEKDSGISYVARSSYNKRMDVQNDIQYLEANSRTEIIVDDLKRGGLSRIKYALKKVDRWSTDAKSYYIIPVAVLPSFIAATNWVGNDWKYTSSFEKIPDTLRGETSKATYKTLVKYPYSHKISSQLEPISQTALDDASSAIIFPIERYALINGNQPRTVRPFLQYLNQKNLAEFGDEIYVVFCSKVQYNKIADDDSSIGFKIDNVLKMDSVVKAIQKDVNVIDCSDINITSNFKTNFKNFDTSKLDKNNPMVDLQKWLSKNFDNNLNSDLRGDVESFIQDFNHNVVKIDEAIKADLKVEFDLKLKVITEKYPLLPYFFNPVDTYYHVNSVGLIEYIGQMDQLKNLQELNEKF